MNRKFATVLILGLLGSLFFLRESPLALLIATAVVAVTGMLGVSISNKEPRLWMVVLGTLGTSWFIGRCVLGSEVRSLFIGEALLFCIGVECLRIKDWTRRSVTIPALAVIALICVMQQRIAFESLGLYTFLGTSVVLSVGWFSTENRHRPSRPFFAKRASVAIAILGVAGFSSFKVSEVWGEQISVLENKVETWLSQFTTEDPVSPYARSGDLASISLEKMYNPDEVAFRVYSSIAPGYMASRVFDVFDRRRWRIVSQRIRENAEYPRFDTLTPVSDSGIRVPQGEKIFRLDDPGPSPRFTTFEISNVSGRGPMVFTPRSTRYVRGYGRQLTVDKAGIVFSGLNTDSKYYAYSDPQAPESFPFDDRPEGDKLREQMLQLHLAVPKETRELLTPIAEEVIGDIKDVEEQRAAIVDYLVKDFRYSLTPITSIRRSELLDKFIDQKEGHCELFATTAAMLMRIKGTPTRYVIGYVCRDRDPDDNDYWAALNRNAHAWVEAWDAERRKWVLVETTPDMVEIAEEEVAASENTGEEDNLEEELRGGSTTGLSDGRWYRVFQWVGLVVTCLMLGWTWLRFADRGGDRSVANEAILKLDRRLARAGLVRRTGETLHEFADRVESDGDPAKCDLQQAASFYRDYASLLYAGEGDRLAALPLPAAT